MIKEEHIVFLTITTWVGTCALGATHYYGRLRPLDGDQSFDVNYKMDKEDVKIMNKTWLIKDNCLDAYKIGEKSERFRDEKRLIANARKQFKIDFPKAKVLVLGDGAVVEPQEILVGPREFKTKINRLARRAKKINYWEGNEVEMQKLCDEWHELWPRKYRSL